MSAEFCFQIKHKLILKINTCKLRYMYMHLTLKCAFCNVQFLHHTCLFLLVVHWSFTLRRWLWMWYSNGREMKLDWSSGNNRHCHSSIIFHQRGVRKNRATRAWHFHTPENIVIHACTLLSHKSSMKRDSIYHHWQRLVDLTFTWPYWNKLSCQKPVFLEQGWCNSSISLCLVANWMSFELTLNRIVTLLHSKKSLCHGQIDKLFAARSTEKNTASE